MAPIKVFMSVGRTSTEQQEKFVATVEEFMRANGVEPMTVGRNYFSSKQPLVAVTELMRECAGSLILAYERIYIADGIDRRGNAKQSSVKDVKLPTVWNQIEASMAYVLGHPLLVMVENGLRNEGLLERDYDWFVKWFDLGMPIADDPEFVGVFKDWKQRLQNSEMVAAVASKPSSQVDSTIAPLLATLDDPPVTRERLSQLRQTLDQSIGLDDLRLVCFDLAEDYENLPGDSKSIKIMNLLLKLERNKTVPKLIEVGKRIRGDITW